MNMSTLFRDPAFWAVTLFVVPLLLRVPIAMALGCASIAVAYFWRLGIDMTSYNFFASIVKYPLLAIPFFILAGNLMNVGGITTRIFRFASALVGHIPGGLGQVNIVASIIFSGMSGSAVADAAGLGQIGHTAMTDDGYDPVVSASLVAASSVIGPVIPPSIPFVLYGAITGLSVARLFMAGFIPGLGLATLFACAIVFMVKFMPEKAGVVRLPVDEELRRLIRDAGFVPKQRDTLYRTYFLN